MLASASCRLSPPTVFYDPRALAQNDRRVRPTLDRFAPYGFGQERRLRDFFFRKEKVRDTRSQ
jgi:hypothetical protein